MNYIGLIVAVVLAAVFSGILIWIVGMFGLGMQVDSMGTAFVAGTAIAVFGGAITWLMSLWELKVSNGTLRFIINALVGAVVLMYGARFIPGLTVNGFTGALAASVAIGIIATVLSIPLRRINQKAAAEQGTIDPS